MVRASEVGFNLRENAPLSCKTLHTVGSWPTGLQDSERVNRFLLTAEAGYELIPAQRMKRIYLLIPFPFGIP
jgi:hypothetical protein